ncbi:outer membrane biogenesis protein BamB [Caulifigura coniformis]|uniref:Outer membrane biogenesis protein BamB n=1 Tax=Caulifigura coniformis TaxID=2527983 RepID=A0A517S987_9PLAN|nr:PQQ-binding-like beta-propeller repeat protein [Caulifigura coniformis]QDT52697.1 outer membrane biogenesis protein BamB [Caulifigura coniformis]
MHRWFGAVVVVLGLTSQAAAKDWLDFRGPTAQGLSDATRLPTTWSETENVVWKTEIPGLGWSTPVIVGNRLFITTAVQEGDDAQSLRALCIDPRSGEILWNNELFRTESKVEIHKKNSHASASPLIDGDRVFLHFGPHGTAAVDFDGKVLWKTNELKYLPQHGVGGSPALAGNHLVICCDGHDSQYVAALDKTTGHVAWKTPRDVGFSKGFSFGTPLVVDINGQTQAICPGSGAIMSYDPANGKELWRVRHGNWSVVPRPVYANGLVIACTGYEKGKILAIDPTGSGDITDSHVKWSLERGVPYNPSPVVVGDDVYFVSDAGIISCVDVSSGKVHWTERVGGKYSASLLYADGKIYAQNEEGRSIVFKPGHTFEKIAENEFANGLRTYASYTPIDGALFLRSESHLYRVGEKENVAAK